jgi:plastocyanin
MRVGRRVGARGAVVGCVLVLVLVATACGKSSSTTAPTPGGGLVTTPAGTSGSTGGTGATGTTGATGASGASALTVTQDNFQFDPTKVTVASGDTITVQNLNGTTPHTFTIKSSDIDIVNDHGLSTEVKIDLPPGTYTYFCRFHVSLGMKGTLTVT